MIEREPKYKRIGERLIRTLPEFETLKDIGVRIAWLRSDEEKKKNYKIVYGDCARVAERYSWICHYDFMITVYEPNCAGMNDHQIETLIRHELHHVGIHTDGNEPSFYVIPHDVEEFLDIIHDEGLDWDRRDNETRNEPKQPQQSG